MGSIRTFWRANRVAVMLFLVLVLSVKLLVPQGFMLGHVPGMRYLTVQLCFDGLTHRTTQIAIPMTGESGKTGEGGGSDQSCPFMSLGMGTLGAVDAPLLAAFIAYILALGFAPVRSAPRGRTPFLRPPLRGPPAFR